MVFAVRFFDVGDLFVTIDALIDETLG